MRYTIDNKLFVAICMDKEVPYYITLKLKPENGLKMREKYADVIPGYYCNNVHWNSINPNGKVPDDELNLMKEKLATCIKKLEETI